MCAHRWRNYRFREVQETGQANSVEPGFMAWVHIQSNALSSLILLPFHCNSCYLDVAWDTMVITTEVGRVMAPKDVLILIPETVNTFHGTSDFAGIIRDLEMRRWFWIIHMDLRMRGRQGGERKWKRQDDRSRGWSIVGSWAKGYRRS